MIDLVRASLPLKVGNVVRRKGISVVAWKDASHMNHGVLDRKTVDESCRLKRMGLSDAGWDAERPVRPGSFLGCASDRASQFCLAV